MLAVAGSNKWNRGLAALKGDVKKVATGDPRDVVKIPMSKMKNAVAAIVAGIRIRCDMIILSTSVYPRAVIVPDRR